MLKQSTAIAAVAIFDQRPLLPQPFQLAYNFPQTTTFCPAEGSTQDPLLMSALA